MKIQHPLGHLVLKEFYAGENTSEKVKVYPEEIMDYMTELLHLYKDRYAGDKGNYEVLPIEFTIDLKLLDKNTGAIVIIDTNAV